MRPGRRTLGATPPPDGVHRWTGSAAMDRQGGGPFAVAAHGPPRPVDLGP